jgi:hypothetical protein
MDGVLHISLRVKDPRRSAELFAEILDGEVRPTPMDAWGVACVFTQEERLSWHMNMLEFWPANKHWELGQLVDVDTETQRSFCHVAFLVDKTFEDLAKIANKYGVVLRQEERAVGSPVPVLYDGNGNYFEFFRRAQLEAAE